MTTYLATISFEAGDTKYIDATVTNTLGLPVDLTGLLTTAVTYQFMDTNQTIKFTLTIGAGIALTDPDAGQFRVTLTPALTVLLPTGHYLHKAIVTIAGVIETVFYGQVELR
jgi:hypothetical protein